MSRPVIPVVVHTVVYRLHDRVVRQPLDALRPVLLLDILDVPTPRVVPALVKPLLAETADSRSGRDLTEVARSWIHVVPIAEQRASAVPGELGLTTRLGLVGRVEHVVV